MGHQTDTNHSDEDSTLLPQPELNPLLNPLLGEHMGRWAEVYFTAAPENRDEAVLALLRQLESEAAAEPQARAPEAPVDTDNAARATYDSLATPSKPAWIQAFDQTSLTCESCGARVPKTHRFCGTCGARLHTESPEGRNYYDDNDEQYTTVEESSEEFYSEHQENFPEAVFSFGGNVPAADDSVPYRYRMYIGAALIILFAALATMAYRSAQGWIGNSRSLPQAVPGEATQSAAQTPPKAETPAPTPKVKNRSVVTGSDQEVVPKAVSHQDTRAATDATTASNNVPSAPPKPSSVAANQGNGAEELSVAERYLNGARGSARDSGEAARWLWQAVGKKNATAALLLSDLYLRGDGVPKSCDQARVLLDAAASKGLAGAGERLQNLQAFGCQ